MSVVRSLLEKIEKSMDYCVEPNATVHEALELMKKHDIGGVLVMEGKTLVGIFTERDNARKISLQGRIPKKRKVSYAMTEHPGLRIVSPLTTFEECLLLMETEPKVKHLPVLEAGKVVGLISLSNVTEGIVEYQTHLMQQFQGYMTGRT